MTTTLSQPTESALSPTITRLTYVYDDGGRQASGRKGTARDCVTRALSIAAGLDYDYAYSEVAERVKAYDARRPKSARNGVPNQLTRQIFADFDFTWHPTMFIGSGTKYHLDADLFTHPQLATLNVYPTIVASVSKHVCALIPTSTTNYAIRDTFDPRRYDNNPLNYRPTRAVYGFWVANYADML